MDKKILIVEDDEINLIIVEHILNMEGYEVAKATNGKEAISMIEAHPFELVLMDVEMPVMDGLEATPHIRNLENGINVPIVALTAHSMESKFQEIADAGMNDYIIKPFDQPKAKTIINKYLTKGKETMVDSQ